MECAAQEEAKKEIADRLREETEEPAFQAQIEDGQTVIDLFSGKPSTATLSNQKSLTEKTDVAGVPKLDIWKVEDPEKPVEWAGSTRCVRRSSAGPMFPFLMLSEHAKLTRPNLSMEYLRGAVRRGPFVDAT